MTTSFPIRPRRCHLLLALLFCGVVAPPLAQADPISVDVSSGGAFLSVSGSDELSFEFFLPGIGPVRGESSEELGLQAASFPPPPSLAPGVPYTLSSAATFSSGQIMLDGILGPVIPAWRVSGALTFEGGTGPLVPEIMPWGTQYMAVAPFTFTGTLNQYDWETGALLQRFELTGRGTGRAFFHDYPGAPQPPVVGYFAYTFEAAEPVPEPTTLLLIAGGLTAAFVRRRRG